MEIKEHVPLKIIEKIQLQIHAAMCSGCKNYMKQTKLINMLLNKNFGPLPRILSLHWNFFQLELPFMVTQISHRLMIQNDCRNIKITGDKKKIAKKHF